MFLLNKTCIKHQMAPFIDAANSCVYIAYNFFLGRIKMSLIFKRIENLQIIVIMKFGYVKVSNPPPPLFHQKAEFHQFQPLMWPLRFYCDHPFLKSIFTFRRFSAFQKVHVGAINPPSLKPTILYGYKHSSLLKSKIWQIC